MITFMVFPNGFRIKTFTKPYFTEIDFPFQIHNCTFPALVKEIMFFKKSFWLMGLINQCRV